ncbi:SUPV3L1, partial [Cordylochernes scorpioides]
NLFYKSRVSFRSYCLSRGVLPLPLNVLMSDMIVMGNTVSVVFSVVGAVVVGIENPASLAALIPFFLQHAKNIFPHLSCLPSLKQISDLRHPANWYSEARDRKRKIVFHAGPTNSGKTYHALKRFTESKSGLYCGPLKMLAVEVFNKTNELGTPCDLITGEERQYSIDKDHPADHLACTIEMASTRHRLHVVQAMIIMVGRKYRVVQLVFTTGGGVADEVAVIDEIQMIRDPNRGWAWTRALLGLAADEIHVCGEEAAIQLVSDLVNAIYENVEVNRYKRLTDLVIEDKSLDGIADVLADSLENVQPGDCIVCFNKNDIYKVNIALEGMGHQCAVIYGSMPPGAKMSLTKKFNDPKEPCNILVATDAIGMGLNLSIHRIIFYSLTKPSINEEGKKKMGLITPSAALQIAGRAGRYGTVYAQGKVTTYRAEDLPVLRDLLAQPVEPIQTAGIHPPAEQIEAFAYHLPQATLSNLVDMFVTLSQLDSVKYHLCDMDSFKVLADLIQHLDLDLRTRYTLCTAPINQKAPMVISMFRLLVSSQFAARFAQCDPITWNWLKPYVKYPFKMPHTIADLSQLESVFDILDLYLWLSYRFPDMFPDLDLVRHIQGDLDTLIQRGIANLTRLIKAGMSRPSLSSNHTTVHAIQAMIIMLGRSRRLLLL